MHICCNSIRSNFIIDIIFYCQYSSSSWETCQKWGDTVSDIAQLYRMTCPCPQTFQNLSQEPTNECNHWEKKKKVTIRMLLNRRHIMFGLTLFLKSRLCFCRTLIYVVLQWYSIMCNLPVLAIACIFSLLVLFYLWWPLRSCHSAVNNHLQLISLIYNIFRDKRGLFKKTPILFLLHSRDS